MTPGIARRLDALNISVFGGVSLRKKRNEKIKERGLMGVASDPDSNIQPRINDETIKELKKYGYQGFLMGENFMKTEFPGKTAALFIKDLE